MQKNKKSRTQDASKQENSVDDISPDTGQASGTDNSVNNRVAPQKKGKTKNEGNEVKADITKSKSGAKSKTSASRSKKTANSNDNEVTANTGGNLATVDREAIIASVDADAERQTGRPTGAIYGSGGDIIAVQNPAGSGASAAAAVAYAKVYGLIQASGDSVFLSQGSIPEGQLQLIGQSEDQGFQGQASRYNEQFVTVLGMYPSQGDGNPGETMFVVRSIASHNDIARRAYELSESENSSPEDNWIRAENELLGQS